MPLSLYGKSLCAILRVEARLSRLRLWRMAFENAADNFVKYAGLFRET